MSHKGNYRSHDNINTYLTELLTLFMSSSDVSRLENITIVRDNQKREPIKLTHASSTSSSTNSEDLKTFLVGGRPRGRLKNYGLERKTMLR